MNFIALNFECDPAFSDVLIAELSEIKFDTFMENDHGFQACALADEYDEEAVKEIVNRYKQLIVPMSYTVETIERKNWNEEWEKNYDPIIVADKCIVRASFHEPAQTYAYEIVINPKMSFGTGHHETTHLMLKMQMEIDHKDKAVLDVGCGTGILAIMAHKLGAKAVKACDIEEWAVKNSIENFELNHCTAMACFEGTIANIPNLGRQDIILANINRNVLLAEIPTYTALLNQGAYLLLSGFYEKDIADIAAMAKENGLNKISYETKKDWSAVLFQKVA